jgi:hypothetical protein
MLAWICKSFAAGLCGALAHTGLMFVKSTFGLLPSFDPYAALQAALATWPLAAAHPALAWALSFVSGATVLGLVFGRLYTRLPGRTGAAKGVIFGACAWFPMGALLFPAIGLGPFGWAADLGIAAALLSLTMLVVYGGVMGAAYAAFARLPGA